MIITQTNFDKARKLIREAREETAFCSDDDELNRKILEKCPPHVLLLNQKNRTDFAKQRNSGLNHVMAKLCKKNNVALGIYLDEIKNESSKQKAKILARIQQNIALVKKNNLAITFFSKNKIDSYNLKALGLVLGMNTKMVKTLQAKTF